MTYPKFTETFPTDISWVGDLPKNWKLVRLGFLFDLQRRPPQPGQGVVTAFRDGQVTLRSKRRVDGYTEADKEIGYQTVLPGDLVIHAMDAFAGAIGVSDSEGKCSPVCSVCTPREGVDSRFYGYAMRHIALSGFITSLAKGIRERSTDFRWADARLLPVPVPPNAAQIVTFIRRETAKIDRLIAKQERLIELSKEKLIALVSADDSAQTSTRIRHCVDIIERPVTLDPLGSYIKVGMFNRGRGLFKKPEEIGSEMGDSDFYWIEDGDLVLSGQFAWEGAVGIADSDFNGCVVSHRYPVIRGRPGWVNTEYLLVLFWSKYGHFLLNENSRGAAGRNRPLNLNSLLNEKIVVPSAEVQKRVSELYSWRKVFLAKVSLQRERLLEHRQALISAAVTGKIDIRGLVTDEEVAALDAESEEIPDLKTEEDASYTTEEEQG